VTVLQLSTPPTLSATIHYTLLQTGQTDRWQYRSKSRS